MLGPLALTLLIIAGFVLALLVGALGAYLAIRYIGRRQR